MKTEKEVQELYDFIGYFNDGLFMNQPYRKGIMDALSFVLYNNEKLQRVLEHLKKKYGEE